MDQSLGSNGSPEACMAVVTAEREVCLELFERHRRSLKTALEGAPTTLWTSGHPSGVPADRRFGEAVRAFKERHTHFAGAGLHSIEPAYSAGEPYLLVGVDPGFASERLPAVFMGLPVVMDDGTRTCHATGNTLQPPRRKRSDRSARRSASAS